MAGTAVVVSGKAILASDTTQTQVTTGPNSLGLCSLPTVMTTCSINPFIHAPKLAVNEQFLEKFTLRSSNDNSKSTSGLLNEYQISGVRNYFNFVFTHLDGFTVTHYTKEEKGEAAKTEIAMYYPATRTLSLPPLPPTIGTPEYFEYKICVRHEMRHASMHAAQLTLNQDSTLHVPENYYPATLAERAKRDDFIKKGDAEVTRLEALLKNEENGNISKADQKYLKKLRKDSQEVYTAHYKTFNTVLLSTNEINKREQATGRSMIGTTMTELPGYGPVTVEKIEPGQSPAEKNVLISFNDPLHAAVHNIKQVRQTVSNGYSQSNQGYERDAYLHANVPQPLIQALYPDLYEYTNNFIAAARLNRRVKNNNPLTARPKWEDLEMLGKFHFISAPDTFEAEVADHFFKLGQLAFQKGYHLQGKTALETLIANHQHVHQAKYVLAIYDEPNYEKSIERLKLLINTKCPQNVKAAAQVEIAKREFALGNPVAAAKYFKLAVKNGEVLDAAHQAQYADVLELAGHLKDAEKLRKKAEGVETANPQQRMRA
jgi:hypothetical protein